MSHTLSRRKWLQTATAAVGAGLATAPAATPADKTAPSDQGLPFRFSFNTSTIMGQKLPLVQEVEIASRAGYNAIEPWLRELDKHVKDGGDLKDLGKRIRDHGLTVESAIGFAEWIVEDEGRRKKGLEQARREMDMVQQIGGKRIAAPPAGATDKSDLSLLKIAERYGVLLEIGRNIGVIPQVELWGPSKCLSRLGEAAFVAIECGHSQACILADVYHLYKGGSGFKGLTVLAPSVLQVIHMNDYPATPGRAEITDAFRVYPGDGVAPLGEIFRDLRAMGFRGVLSLELFNRDVWQKDPLAVASTGLEKMKAVARASLETPRP
jgi:2-keto-myo-inositol isomerase